MRLIDADALERMGYVLTRTYQQDQKTMVCETKKLSDVPSAQPERNLLKLASEIADFKKHIKSENSDYLTGYLSALSAVEEMIAEMRGEQDGKDD